jgi:protein-L-isoaspartate(D-aspartate) O-methyltransferase
VNAYFTSAAAWHYTAILAEMVGPGGAVVAGEVDPVLASRAQSNLAGYPNMTVHSGDGAELDVTDCDAMLINAGVTHPRPQWLDGLRQAGRMVLPLTAAMPQSPELGRGAMMKIGRSGEKFSVSLVSYAAILSCTSLRDPELNVALGKGLSTGALQKVQTLRRDLHEKVDTCIVHGAAMCLSSV